jgi:hypothetical protein
MDSCNPEVSPCPIRKNSWIVQLYYQGRVDCTERFATREEAFEFYNSKVSRLPLRTRGLVCQLPKGVRMSMHLTDEFDHTLINGVTVHVATEGHVYRDENGDAWIDGFEMSFALDSTPFYVKSLRLLQNEIEAGNLKTLAEDRLVETFDESESEAS